MSSKILIVDDSTLSRRTLRRILEASRYEVIEASDGMSALERYFLEKPNLVLLDLTMEGMHGLDVLRKLREMDPKVKAIVSSGYSNDPVMANYHDYGFVGVVPKPYNIAELSNAVHEAING